MKDVELLAHILHGGGDQVVGLVVGVDPQQVRHDQEVAVGGEDGLELVGGVDDGSHAVPLFHNEGLFQTRAIIHFSSS